MFFLSEISFGKYRRYDFRHLETGVGFSVAPAAGANVPEILFDGVNILDGYESPEEMEAGKWGKSALLFPFPNRLKDGQYDWQGRRYQFPINNEATNNAIHGFAREEVFEVTHIDLGTDHAEITCALDYDGRHAYFPFPLRFEVTYRITNQRNFEVRFVVRNRHTSALPFGIGWHPYFKLAEKADLHQLALPACEQVEIDDRMIPTGNFTPFSAFNRLQTLGNTQLDTCFRVTEPHPQYRMQLCGSARQLTLTASSGLFPYFQVFTPPHRNSIALEPMTCNVDAFNNGLGRIELPAGAVWEGAVRVDWGIGN
jgi:aldose 1-epimerase